MGWHYLQVAETVDSEPTYLPTATDGTLLLTTLEAHFPGASGLKFASEDSTEMTVVRLWKGRFQAPQDDGWGDHIYYCVWHKGKDKKRKLDSGDEVEEDCGKREKVTIKRSYSSRCSDLIVLSLPYKTTDDELKDHFQSFGEVVHAQVNKDADTWESKGFGFIRFASLQSQIEALGQRHYIQGRWCDVKIPNSKDCQEMNVSKRIHVAGLTENISVDDLREYFSIFGEVTHVFIPNPFRGFAYITFVVGAVAQSLCGEEHFIKKKPVTISIASPWGMYPRWSLMDRRNCLPEIERRLKRGSSRRSGGGGIRRHR